jgi:hypothetical protein
MTRQERREQRRNNLLRKLSYRTRRMTRHHLTNRFCGGNDAPNNILILEENRHAAWHLIFGNANPEQAIAIIRRMIAIKGWDDETTHR